MRKYLTLQSSFVAELKLIGFIIQKTTSTPLIDQYITQYTPADGFTSKIDLDWAVSKLIIVQSTIPKMVHICRICNGLILTTNGEKN